MLLRGRTASRALAQTRTLHASTSSTVTVGIRREDSERIWERRCPLTPEAVHELVSREGVRVLVQPCDRRVFSAQDFMNAGAEIHPTLTPAHITVGIKETPLKELLTTPAPPTESSAGPVARTHIMFSHTIKGQHYNMGLLARFLKTPAYNDRGDLIPRLIDYELITGEDGKRTVAFGWYAGVAGALESLAALAHAHLELGVASPLLYTPRPHTHPVLSTIEMALKGISGMIATLGTPPSLGPLVIGVTGKGQVAQGALYILDKLPVEHVTVEDLPNLVRNPDVNLQKIYICHIPPESYLTGLDGRPYERSNYYAQPEAYKSEFHTKVAPFLSLLLNCAGWTPAFPRIMTNDQLAVALEYARSVGKGRMVSVGDISCDIEGGLEFLTRSSTLSEPFYTSRPTSLPTHLPGVQMMAVDILPTSLPRDASEHFSSVFLPYLKSLVGEYRYQEPANDEEKKLRTAMQRATVAQNGTLESAHQWIEGSVEAWRTSVAKANTGDVTASYVGDTASALPTSAKVSSTVISPKKRVLLLGSGMVAGPTVEELCERRDVELVIASNVLSEAEVLAKGRANAQATQLDVSDATKIDSLISQADVVISLLPVPFHPSIAEICIKHQKNLVTASYISPKMRELHQRAQDANVLLLNEIGLDPGIDHCSAVALLDDLKARNMEVVSFISFCGGLPAPECADVPLGYKFSWSPKGVLQATLNSANFKLNNKHHRIAEPELLVSDFKEVPISNVLKFEGIANRDSFPYADTYGLDSAGIRTLLRGTLRYPGYSDVVQSFKELGLLSQSSLPSAIPNWTTFLYRALTSKIGVALSDGDERSLMSAIKDTVSTRDHNRLVETLSWLSLLPSSADYNPPPAPLRTAMAPIDLLTMLLAHKLRYNPGERDMVVLSHEVIARPRGAPSGQQEEIHKSQLIAYGTQSASAMSRTVGLPVAFAARQILDGKVKAKGVHGPNVERSIYHGVLEGLARVGLGMQDTVVKGLSLETQLSKGFRTTT